MAGSQKRMSRGEMTSPQVLPAGGAADSDNENEAVLDPDAVDTTPFGAKLEVRFYNALIKIS